MGLFIHAPNVHQGGGRSLLLALIAVMDSRYKCRAIIDERMVIPNHLLEQITVRRVQPKLIDRLKAEWDLRVQSGVEDRVLCFGNLPPLFKLRAKVFVFVQNRYLVDRVSLKGFPILVRLRIMLERLWLAWRAERVDEFIVQTSTMQRIMQSFMNVTPIILPFSATSSNYSRIVRAPRGNLSAKYDFLYVASAEPHKNHRRLIEAWILLAEEGLRPSLCLTISEKSARNLCAWIKEMQDRYGLHITNVDSISHKEGLNRLYHEARALIYPSIFESMGLPLIEARVMNLPILASELDYVRDIVDPEESFNPYSALSIARAVKRFLCIEEKPLHLLNAASFLKYVIGGVQ